MRFEASDKKQPEQVLVYSELISACQKLTVLKKPDAAHRVIRFFCFRYYRQPDDGKAQWQFSLRLSPSIKGLFSIVLAPRNHENSSRLSGNGQNIIGKENDQIIRGINPGLITVVKRGLPEKRIDCGKFEMLC